MFREQKVSTPTVKGRKELISHAVGSQEPNSSLWGLTELRMRQFWILKPTAFHDRQGQWAELGSSSRISDFHRRNFNVEWDLKSWKLVLLCRSQCCVGNLWRWKGDRTWFTHRLQAKYGQRRLLLYTCLSFSAPWPLVVYWLSMQLYFSILFSLVLSIKWFSCSSQCC